jgi:hypothetical protein
MKGPAMPSVSADRCRSFPPHPRDRQLLPVSRQEIPAKMLKNNEKNSPEILDGPVQDLEAAWHLRHRRCGLEMKG